MALVTGFVEGSAKARVHPTSVECEWQVVLGPRGSLVQLTTFGSARRQMPGKASQTFQLDRESAAELVEILRRTFPGL